MGRSDWEYTFNTFAFAYVYLLLISRCRTEFMPWSQPYALLYNQYHFIDCFVYDELITSLARLVVDLTLAICRYAIGYHFIERKTGSMNGNFLGIGADLMTNASVQVKIKASRRLHV